MSNLEIIFLNKLHHYHLPIPEREYKFLENRRFRFDFAYPQNKIGIEIEGGIWINGRHSRPLGYENDCKKYNLATSNGWKVLRFTTNMINENESFLIIEKLLLK